MCLVLRQSFLFNPFRVDIFRMSFTPGCYPGLLTCDPFRIKISHVESKTFRALNFFSVSSTFPMILFEVSHVVSSIFRIMHQVKIIERQIVSANYKTFSLGFSHVSYASHSLTFLTLSRFSRSHVSLAGDLSDPCNYPPHREIRRDESYRGYVYGTERPSNLYGA